MRVEQPQCAGGKPPAIDAASMPILPDMVTTLNGKEPMTVNTKNVQNIRILIQEYMPILPDIETTLTGLDKVRESL